MINFNNWHLGETSNEFKLFLLSTHIFRTFEAYSNYIEGCEKIANKGNLNNIGNLNANDIIILHSIYAKPFQTIAQIGEFLNNNDIAAILYSIKKLMKEKLIQKVTNNPINRKTVSYEVTKLGMQNAKNFSNVSLSALIPFFKDFDTLDRIELKKHLFMVKILYKKISAAITIHEKILEADLNI